MYVYIHINYSATGPGFCPSSLCGKLKNSLLVFENIARYPAENDMFQPEPKKTKTQKLSKKEAAPNCAKSQIDEL